MEHCNEKKAAMLGALAAALAAASPAAPVPAELFGQNIEHTRSAVQGGLSAQLVRNRKFAGKPSRRGVMQMWEAYGTRAIYAHSGNSFTRHAARSAMFRQNERGSQEVQGLDAAGEAGVMQDRIALRGGVKHEMKVVLSTLHPEDTAVALRVFAGEMTIAAREFSVNTKSRGDWTKIAMEFTPEANVFATVSIGVKGRKGISIGAVSLLPEDNFRGMRRDVIENLREIGASVIRWPGGNFAGEYRWRDGLIEDPDMRAPIQSYTEIETQPHSLGYDSNDIGMEDILALCDAIGAKPFFTINAAWEKPSDSADWVKACKGRVKMWSLGNEMGYGHMEGTSGPEGYNKLVRPHAEAMLAADPSLKLVASGLYPGGGKNWIEKSAKPLADIAPCISYHGYDSPGAFDFTSPERVDALFAGAKKCADSRLKRLGDFRAILPRNIGISYDEWNIWYSWFREEGIVQGLYAARMLTGILKGWEKYGLDCVCYFQPVNEGAIEAGPFESHLTSIGEAMRMMKGHIGGEPCKIDDLPAEAFATDAPDGTRYMTFYNISTREPATFRLPAGGRRTVAGGEMLVPGGLEPGCRYSRKPVSAGIDGDFCEITLPPAHMASVRLAK